jgi:hypothetical protein
MKVAIGYAGDAVFQVLNIPQAPFGACEHVRYDFEQCHRYLDGKCCECHGHVAQWMDD